MIQPINLVEMDFGFCTFRIDYNQKELNRQFFCVSTSQTSMGRQGEGRAVKSANAPHGGVNSNCCKKMSLIHQSKTFDQVVLILFHKIM